MASYSAIINSGEVIIAGGQFFKMAASCSVDVSEEEINSVRNDTLQKQDVKIVLNVTKKPFDMHE